MSTSDTIPVTCPGCKSEFKVFSSNAGKRIRCPKCRVAVQIEDPTENILDSSPALPEEHSTSDKIQTICPGCNARLAVSAENAGKTLKCPKCEASIVVPSPTTVQPPELPVLDEPNEVYVPISGLDNPTPHEREECSTRPSIIDMAGMRKGGAVSPEQSRLRTQKFILLGVAVLIVLQSIQIMLLWPVSVSAAYENGVRQEAHDKLVQKYRDDELRYYVSQEDGRADIVKELTALKAAGNPQNNARIEELEREVESLDSQKKRLDPEGTMLEYLRKQEREIQESVRKREKEIQDVIRQR